MALSTSQALRHYAIDLSHQCPGLPTAEKIYLNLLHSRSVFSSRKVDYNITCTGTDTEPCQIVDNLSTWNEFFWLIDAELKELSPGKLGVVYKLGCRSKEVLKQQRLHACIVLHWLLKEHHCVDTLELETTVIPLNIHLFCYALRHNTGLKRLKLMKYDIEGTVCEDLMAAVATMVGLEELKLVCFSLSTGALKSLGTFLKQTQSLRHLVLHLPRTTTTSVRDLLSGLKANTSLTELGLSDGWLKNENGDAAFAEYLAHNTTLKEFVFEVQDSGGSDSVAVILGSLRTNRCLEKFELFRGNLDEFDGMVLVAVMAVNDTLRSLIVGDEWMSCTTFFAQMIERNASLVELDIVICSGWHLEGIAKAVRKNTKLQRLTLRCSETIVDDTMQLIQAVADSKTLELVVLMNIRELRLGDFSRVIREMGVEGKVNHTSYISQPLICISMIDSEMRLGRKRYGPQDIHEQGVVQNGLRQLVCLAGIVQLTLKLDQDLDLECATLLADFLSSSRALKDVHLSFVTKDLTTSILVHGLKSNRSISNLIIEDWKFSVGNVRLFGSFLKENNTLNYLTVLSSSAWSLTGNMARILAKNYFLLDFKTIELRDLEKSMYRVNEILRRNVSMLYRAVQFVMGSRMKHHAEAFELLYESESLLRAMKEHLPGSECDLKQRIKEGAQYLELNFMTLAGVVKENVVCNSLAEGERLQLDGIGLKNWLKVRSYLKISDVLKKPVSRSSSDGGQKSRSVGRKMV